MSISRKDGSMTRIAKYDVADAELIERYVWHLSADPPHHYYAATMIITNGERQHVHMHQLVIGKPGRVDFLNGNGMDCRRANLRIASQSQILAKRKPSGGASKYKGVAWDAAPGKWMARFRGKNLGRFDVEEDAARAFDDAAFEHWGHQAYFNFPDEVEGWVWEPKPAVDE